ncbi:hypothetical protein PGH07_08270 [Sulfurovum sp. zt1-1]|uniref:Uncharacterized protein n=1 Tax=Sulfurovum zhangzhouensis TaxID=3019067 RepID=A0ABT7QZE8_9BACT|nr:hypothetical protein [Sulfurovum zhangzhouensis]MDM5272173.1 hypothetical protein [Sulfurovum zhangzhouensis]
MNIADVKQELSSDEKVLESAFKLETLYKKYRVVIWSVIVVLILLFVGKSVMTAMEEARLSEANNALLTLQQNPEDTAALNTLKEKNPALFELYSYAQASKTGDKNTLAILSHSSNSVIADASGYTLAVMEDKTTDSVLYKEMTTLEEAYLAIQNGEMKKAQEKLNMIDPRSPVATLAQLLKHSTIKAK